MIRLFVYGIPTLLLALIAASFLNVSLLSTRKTRCRSEHSASLQLSILFRADAAAGEVQAVIFNGLLKCDENLEIIADLAKSFKLSQTTTVFFSDANAALSALLKGRRVTLARLETKECQHPR